MSEERTKPGILSLASLFLGLFLLYILSAILTSWMIGEGPAPTWVSKLYLPLFWLMQFLAGS